MLPARLVEYQRLVSQYARKLFQEAAQYLRSNPSPSTKAPVLQELLTGIQGCVVSSVIQVFRRLSSDVPAGLTLEEDEQFQTERASLDAQLAMLLAAQESLDSISYTAAFIPANKFHLGTYKEAASADFLEPSDAEELVPNPSLHSAALPTPDAPKAEAEYNTPNSPHSGSSSNSSSSQAGDSAASTAASTAASSKSSTPLPITVLADSFSDTSSSEPAAPALDLNDAVAESSSAGSAAEVETHPESVSPTSSSTSDDVVEV